MKMFFVFVAGVAGAVIGASVSRRRLKDCREEIKRLRLKLEKHNNHTDAGFAGIYSRLRCLEKKVFPK